MRPAVRAGPGRRGGLCRRGPAGTSGWAHLARLETATAVQAMLRLLPGLRLGPERPSAAVGLTFRKPSSLAARWDPA